MATNSKQRKPPKLGNGVYHRDIKESVIKDRSLFEATLADWIRGFVSRNRVTSLIVNAEGIDEIHKHVMRTPVSMTLGATRRIHVHFMFGQTKDKSWWVKAVGFYMNASAQEIDGARHQQYREKLEDKAEERAMKKGPTKQRVFFNPKDGSGDLDKDLRHGKSLIAKMIDHIYGKARKVAALMKNPIGADLSDPLSVAGELTKAVGGLAASDWSDAADDIILAYEVVDQTVKGVEYGALAASGKKNAKEATALKAAGDGLDLLAGYISPMGTLTSTILGSFIEIGIVNQAKEIAHLRSLIYLYFVSGVMMELVGEPGERPVTKNQKTWARIGSAFIRPFSEYDCYCFHLAAVDYTGKNNMTAWGLTVVANLNTMEDYTNRWTPGLVERSLLWQLGKKKYLVD